MPALREFSSAPTGGAPKNQIRADFDDRTIVVYQAFRPEIADAAVAAGRFVPPFSRSRMTWIKPSFLWMMERCGWASKPGQERVLAIRITRAGWEEALSQAILSTDEASNAIVRVQWDPERDARGTKLNHRSIQVGLSRHIVDRYVDAWTQTITDVTALVARIDKHRRDGRWEKAAALLPREAIYPTPAAIAKRLGMA